MTLATQNAQMVDRQVEMGETMMMGLRLVQEGVSEKTFQSRFGQSLQECFGPQIKKLISFGLLEWAGETQDILRLTTRGHLLGNRAFLEFV
jgi:oxygen-independent coproporphyrinogen-3 oxidase